MKYRISSLLALGAALGFFPAPGVAQHYVQTNLVSDLALPVDPMNPQGATLTPDPTFLNPWGITRSPEVPATPGHPEKHGGPWWINLNNFGWSSVYNGAGQPANFINEPDGTTGNFVIVPTSPSFPAGSISNPTGIVFNGDPNAFHMPKGTPAGQQAAFIFVGEDGTISGWNPVVDVLAGQNPPSAFPALQVDNSQGGAITGAVYKGATSARTKNGNIFLYVTNFRAGRVEVYDTNFNPVHLDDDAFKPNGDGDGDDHVQDREHIPAGFAPFNIQNIGGSLFVTYAKQNPLKHDDLPGAGNGYVEIYTPEGKHVAHLEHGPWLNSPWGVVWTPRDFGKFSNSILVGNFGSGWIAAFNGFTYKFEGFLKNPDDSLLFIDGLWSLTFGNDGAASPTNTLFFTAGLNHENDGLFGTLVPASNDIDGSTE